jgi:hypothetical protein
VGKEGPSYVRLAPKETLGTTYAMLTAIRPFRRESQQQSWLPLAQTTKVSSARQGRDIAANSLAAQRCKVYVKIFLGCCR